MKGQRPHQLHTLYGPVECGLHRVAMATLSLSVYLVELFSCALLISSESFTYFFHAFMVFILHGQLKLKPL